MVLFFSLALALLPAVTARGLNVMLPSDSSILDNAPNSTPVYPRQMSDQNDNPVMPFLDQWLTDHQNNNNVIVVASQSADNYTFEAAFQQNFVLNGTINLITHDLTNSQFTLLVPLFGSIPVATDLNGNLDGTVTSKFTFGPSVNGTFTLSLDNSEPQNFVISYDFSIDFIGSVQDTTALFPLPQSQQQGAFVKPSNALPTLVTSDVCSELCQLYGDFVADHVDLGTGIVIVASFEQDSNAHGKRSASKEYNFDVSFLGILEMEGAIEPVNRIIGATLYVRVPIWGRVKITSLSGSLDPGITLNIDVLVAKGTVGLRQQGLHDVRCAVNLDVKFVGKINNDIKLFTLPF